MSIRLYIGNLPQTFDEQELAALLKSVGEGIRFKLFWIVKPAPAGDSALPTSMTKNWLMR